jgi:2,3-bisphosphoglycerate-independent phosphoglycerate mutase
MHKVLLIICDGLSDRPIFELGGKTPLEAAATPNLDKLASRGMTGVMHTVDIGVRPGSDVAHLSIFGYDTERYYTGRGPFEAAGLGMDIQPQDIACRGNFATVTSDFILTDRRASRIDTTTDLLKSLEKINISGVKIFIKKGLGHRIAVLFRGKNLDGRVSDTDPHHEGTNLLKAKPTVDNEKAKKTAKIINEFVSKSYEILKNHPVNKKREQAGLPAANIVLLRGAGSLPTLPSFKEKYHLTAACIAGAGLYKGIGKLLGMDIITVAGATGKLDTNLSAKIKAALSAFSKYDFVFIHIKACDNLAEDGDFLGKKKFIEKIDRSLSPLVKRDDILIVITADHTTSSVLKMHTADPVPLLIAGKNLHTDYVTQFGEREVAAGRLGHIQGKHLMPIILDFLGRAPLYGA